MKKVVSIILSLALILHLGLFTTAQDIELNPSYHEITISTTAGTKGYYQYDESTDDFVYVPAANPEDLDTAPVPDTINEESSATSPYTVTPPDSRVKITNVTGRYASTCLIGARFGPSDYDVFSGTGWLINDSYVATAGHMLYDEAYQNNGNGGYALHVAVYVGATGGTCKEYRLGHVENVGAGYVDNPIGSGFYTLAGKYDDWGVIKLDSPVTANVGHLGRCPVSSVSDMTGSIYYSQGYPEDLNSGISRWDDFYMYSTTGDIVSGDGETCVVTNLDTYDGQSGSPIYSYHSTLGYAVEAIHISRSDGALNNTAILLTPQLQGYFNDLS